MDSLINYVSDGETSNNSIDTKMFPDSRLANRRSSDANYDPVQMDMSEESNNNNSSDESGSEHGSNSLPNRRDLNVPKADSPTRTPPTLRQPEHEKQTLNTQEESRRNEKSEKSKHSSERGRRTSHDDRKRSSDYKDSRDYRKSRDDDRRYRDDDRRKERDRVSSSRDHRDKSYRDDRRERDKLRDRDRGRDKRQMDRDHNRRRSRDGRSKDRYRDERPSYHKDRDRTKSRSRSRDRNQPNYRSLSYREEKNRSKLAQLEKLGIELKSPEDEPGANNSQEQNYYNPLTTATQGKYAEQIQKRKLLWANKKPDEGKVAATPTTATNTWVGTTFTHDQDGKVTAKFKRLMGIKGESTAASAESSKPDILKKQEEMFTNMEQQYEVARATTHTQRGVGLGYSTGGYQFPR